MEKCPYHDVEATEDEYGLICLYGCYTFHPAYDSPLNALEARTGWRKVEKATNSPSAPDVPAVRRAVDRAPDVHRDRGVGCSCGRIKEDSSEPVRHQSTASAMSA